MFRGEATNTNYIVFGLTWSLLEPIIYHTRGEHDAVFGLSTTLEASTMLFLVYLPHSRRARCCFWSIYHTRGEHDAVFGLSTTLEASTMLFLVYLPHSRRARCCFWSIYHTRGEHDAVFGLSTTLEASTMLFLVNWS